MTSTTDALISAIGYLAVLAVLLHECSCSSRAQVIEPKRAETPWCFAVALEWRDGTEAGQVCGSTLDVCESVRRRAVRWGGVAKLREVGACGRRGE